MFTIFRLAVAAACLTAGAAHATTVGSFTFDDNAFADNAEIALTIGGTRGPAQSPASGADGNLSTATNLNDSFVEIFFTDNVLINGPGADLVLFTNTNNNVIRLYTGAGLQFDWNTGIGPSTQIPVNAPGNTSGFGIGGVEYDLSDLGYAEGTEFTDGLFLARGGVFTTVWDVAALNSRDAVIINPDPDPNPSPVPLPAGLPLLLGAFGALGWMRRRA